MLYPNNFIKFFVGCFTLNIGPIGPLDHSAKKFWLIIYTGLILIKNTHILIQTVNFVLKMFNFSILKPIIFSIRCQQLYLWILACINIYFGIFENQKKYLHQNQHYNSTKLSLKTQQLSFEQSKFQKFCY